MATFDPNPAHRDELARLLRDLLAEVRAMRRDAARREIDAQRAVTRQHHQHMDDYWLKLIFGMGALLLAAIAIVGGFALAAT